MDSRNVKTARMPCTGEARGLSHVKLGVAAISTAHPSANISRATSSSMALEASFKFCDRDIRLRLE